MIEKVEFKHCYSQWSKFQHLLNQEMDIIANFPCDEEENLSGLYCKRIKQSPEQYCYFYKVQEKYVGMITYIGYNQYISIRDFYVLPEYRNKNYGTELFQAVLKERNNRNVYVGTVGGNERALRLYKNLGFRILGYELQLT